MRTDAVVGVLPEGDHGLGLLERVENLLAQAIVAQLNVEAFTVTVLPREPGAIYWICEPALATHLRNAVETISGPLSQRMCSGMPCRHMASASASITPSLLMRRATFSARQARLCSSISIRCARFGRRASAPARSRSSRRDCGGAAVVAHTSRRSVRGGCGAYVDWGPSAPRDAGCAEPDPCTPPPRCLQQRGNTAIAVGSVLGRQGDDGAGQPILFGRQRGSGAIRRGDPERVRGPRGGGPAERRRPPGPRPQPEPRGMG